MNFGQSHGPLDACILYPAPLRDLLMHLALIDLFGAEWTAAIHEEWIRNLLKDRPDLKRRQLERTKQLMNAHVRDCLVVGYEHLIDTVTLPDPDDRHVLAAAIHSGTDVILTLNLSDFPAKTLAKHGMQAQHPDQFIAHLIDTTPELACAAVKRQRECLKNPPKSAQELIAVLERQGLSKTVARLRELIDLI